MERSVIRERRCSVSFGPGFRCASSGLRRKERERRRNAERRLVTIRATPTRVATRRRFRARRASRRGTRSPLGVPSRFSPVGCHLPAQLQARLPGTWTLPFARRALPAPSCPSPEGTPRTGRSTGAHDAQSRPGADGKSARRHRTRSDRPACRPCGVLMSERFALPLFGASAFSMIIFL